MAKRQRTAETLPVDAIDLPRDVMLEIILEALGNAENRAEAAEKRATLWKTRADAEKKRADDAGDSAARSFGNSP